MPGDADAQDGGALQVIALAGLLRLLDEEWPVSAHKAISLAEILDDDDADWLPLGRRPKRRRNRAAAAVKPA